MEKNYDEMTKIVGKFAESGWDLIQMPSQKWLKNMNDPQLTEELIIAIKKADEECGSCGCEFDPLYKKFLKLCS